MQKVAVGNFEASGQFRRPRLRLILAKPVVIICTSWNPVADFLSVVMQIGVS
jgi:hypothetical protein